jgi:hypothetical protein
MKFTLLMLSALALFSTASGQLRRGGTWKDYLSYSKATKTVVAGTKIWCASTGGLFYFDTSDNSVNKFTSSDGLTDFGIKTLAWSEEIKVLIVAYNNSNIDLIYENRVLNLSDIRRKQMTADKTINNITIIGKEAYLACGFGIVVLNLEKNEVKSTWFIGENGSPSPVFDVESDETSIYAATGKGILKAQKSNANLQDFRNWSRIENIPRFTEKFSHLAVHSGKLIANYTPDQYAEDEMYILNGNAWARYLPAIGYAREISVSGNVMLVSSRAEVYMVDANHSIAGKMNSYLYDSKTISPIEPRSAQIAQGNVIWIADYNQGLVKITATAHAFLSPNGPVDNTIFSLTANGNDVWVAPGGRTDSWSNNWNNAYFQLYRGGSWKLFSKKEYPALEKLFDITSVTPNPGNPDHFFATSWGGGVFEFKGDKLVNHFTHKNTPLQSALPPDNEVHFVRIGGSAFDSQGNLWITNSETAKNLLKLTPDGKWESFALLEVANSRNIGQIINTKSDDKWIVIPRGHDLVVTDKTGQKSIRLLITAQAGSSYSQRKNDVYSIAEDQNGAIWIGTSTGVAVYSFPQKVWDTPGITAGQPSLNLNDGYLHPLLESETVTAIAVDGANRKWLGTKNSGVYLVSENGDTELRHFTSDNSPLLSNTITSIAINPETGEVFFGTKEGLISYQGDAISGKSAYSNVYVYPNPVRETWDGPVTITGLIEETDVRITDIAGNLVHKTKSLGGQAVWNGKTLNGNRPKTGVYLVFCTDKTGSETCITKFLFIH